MTTPLVKQIAKAVKSALVGAKAVESATLLRTTPGSRTVGNLGGGTNPTTTSYPCKGFVSDEQHKKIGGTLVDTTHAIICVLGLGELVPTSNDRVTIDSKTYAIVDLQGSPALWTLLCRK